MKRRRLPDLETPRPLAAWGRVVGCPPAILRELLPDVAGGRVPFSRVAAALSREAAAVRARRRAERVARLAAIVSRAASAWAPFSR